MKFILTILLALALCHPAMAMRSFETRGSDSVGTLTPPLSDYVNWYSLQANTTKTVIWPDGANVALIAASDIILVRTGGQDIALPEGDVTDGTAPFIWPGQLRKGSESSFQIMTPNDNVVVSIAFYKD